MEEKAVATLSECSLPKEGPRHSVHFKSAFPRNTAFLQLGFSRKQPLLSPSVKLRVSFSLFLSLSLSLSLSLFHGLEVNLYFRGRFKMQRCNLELFKAEVERHNWLVLRSHGI